MQFKCPFSSPTVCPDLKLWDRYHKCLGLWQAEQVGGHSSTLDHSLYLLQFGLGQPLCHCLFLQHAPARETYGLLRVGLTCEDSHSFCACSVDLRSAYSASQFLLLTLVNSSINIQDSHVHFSLIIFIPLGIYVWCYVQPHISSLLLGMACHTAVNLEWPKVNQWLSSWNMT